MTKIYHKTPVIRYMNCKAITEATLALLIIAIITMGFLTVFVYNYGERQTCTQKIELCRTSMMLFNTFRKIPGQALMLEPKIDCPICVPGSSEKIKNEDQQKNLYEVAEHLRWCWHKTLGTANKIAGNTFLLFYFGKKNCVVCSEFTTDKDVKPQELINYLQKTKIRIGPGAGKTYAQYLDVDLDLEGLFSYKILPHIATVTDWSFLRFFDDIKSLLSKGWAAYLLIPDEARTLQPITSNEKFQLIRYFWMTPVKPILFNQMFFVPNSEVPQLPCDVYHYQKE